MWSVELRVTKPLLFQLVGGVSLGTLALKLTSVKLRFSILTRLQFNYSLVQYIYIFFAFLSKKKNT